MSIAISFSTTGIACGFTIQQKVPSKNAEYKKISIECYIEGSILALFHSMLFHNSLLSFSRHDLTISLSIQNVTHIFFRCHTQIHVILIQRFRGKVFIVKGIFIQKYSESEEEHCGLIVYFDKSADILCFSDIHPAAAFLKNQLHQKTFLQRCKP